MKPLKKIKKELYTIKNGEKIIITNDNKNDFKIKGDVSEIIGDVSKIRGNVSGVEGNFDEIPMDKRGDDFNLEDWIEE